MGACFDSVKFSASSVPELKVHFKNYQGYVF